LSRFRCSFDRIAAVEMVSDENMKMAKSQVQVGSFLCLTMAHLKSEHLYPYTTFSRQVERQRGNAPGYLSQVLGGRLLGATPVQGVCRAHLVAIEPRRNRASSQCDPYLHCESHTATTTPNDHMAVSVYPIVRSEREPTDFLEVGSTVSCIRARPLMSEWDNDEHGTTYLGHCNMK
jgi:hypothetical protein